MTRNKAGKCMTLALDNLSVFVLGLLLEVVRAGKCKNGGCETLRMIMVARCR